MTDQDLLERLVALDTTTVSDALDFLNLAGATVGIVPLWNCPKVVGRASTVQLGPKKEAAPTVHLITPVVAEITTHDRVLMIAGGIDGISCWGDILANAAKQKQIRGTLIDGYSRDIETNEQLEYPVYGRGVTMISARNRVVQYDAGQPIQFAGVTVHQDDYVIADRCGTVIVPQQQISKVLDLAERIQRRQDGMVEAVKAGRSVEEVMHDQQFEAIKVEESA